MEFTRDENHFLANLYPLKDAQGRYYGERAEGYIRFGDVADHMLWPQQTQYSSRYIDGAIPGYPSLGNGLRFNDGHGGNYHAIGIHPEDIEEYVRRAWTYRAYKHGEVQDDNGHVYPLEERDREALGHYLGGLGLLPNVE